MANHYDIGDRVEMCGMFRTKAGALTDPSTVTCILKTPDGTETSYVYGTDSEMTKNGTGNFQCTITLTQAGVHHYRFKGVGALVAAGENKFTARASAFTTP